MAPLAIRDDFPNPSSINPGVVFAIIAGVLIALAILITILRAASRARRTLPRRPPAPRVAPSGGNATDYLRPDRPGNRTTRTAGNNDTFSTAWKVEDNNIIMTTMNNNAAAAAAASASPPAVHVPHVHHDHPLPPLPASPPPSGPTDMGTSWGAPTAPDPPPAYSEPFSGSM
ncbi:hypothetical protein GSI_13368 [Ganoderma sinense ZZ0214-1]|uniref:Uncharacterized protein n=1 Tax=Ganoderma sinense ZZ0214-1 TaxID=1077348 RepID=A0A2G8RVX1_9APHY|nr:hypothetical protein GSI_13368 [Ganoderma sinense ZZ0214-1]